MSTLLLALVFGAAAQTPTAAVSITQVGVREVAELQAGMASMFGPDALPAATGAVTLYKVTYRSTDFAGMPTTLSGLVALPAQGAPKGLVVFFHGTTSDPEEAPSRYSGGPAMCEANIATLAFATGGYAVAMPDYIGLGDNAGVHPYPLGSVNCRSGIDMIEPARQAARSQGVAIGTDLYITGYSEGGQVAAWATKTLQEAPRPQHRITASAALSGPYDASGVMAPSLVEPISNPEWLAARLYVGAFSGYSISHYYPQIRLADLFVPSFATYLPLVFSRKQSSEAAAKQVAIKALELGALRSVERVMQPPAFRALQSSDTNFPFLKVLAAQDVYDWSPRQPMLLVCLKQDLLVMPENTWKLYRTMRARGVPRTIIGYCDIDDAKLNHITATPAACALARKFFDGGFKAVPRSDS